MEHNPTDVIDQQEYINSIDEKNEDVTFKLRKDGNYAAITYKQAVEALFQKHPFLTWGGLYDLINKPRLFGDTLEDAVKNHAYFSKNK